MNSIDHFYQQRYKNLSVGLKDEKTNFGVEAVLRSIAGPSKRVLDFGCNTGRACQRFAQNGHQVTGVDLAETLIETARQRVPEGRFVKIESGNPLPFEDGSFDVCFAGEVVEHLFDVRGFFKEMHRLLVPGGSLFVVVPYHEWLKNLLVISFNFEKHFSPHAGHIRFFTQRSLIQCFESHSFRVEEFKGLGRFWPLWKTMLIQGIKN